MNDTRISIVHGKNGRGAALWVVLVFMIVVVSACTPTAPARIPDGEYTISEDHGYGTGTLTMVLDNGHFNVSTPDVGELANGGFIITNNKITFTEEVTSPKEKSMCGSKVTYSYLWTFDAQKGELHFTQDKDDCELRAFTNIGGHEIQPWHLKTKDGVGIKGIGERRATFIRWAWEESAVGVSPNGGHKAQLGKIP